MVTVLSIELVTSLETCAYKKIFRAGMLREREREREREKERDRQSKDAMQFVSIAFYGQIKYM